MLALWIEEYTQNVASNYTIASSEQQEMMSSLPSSSLPSSCEVVIVGAGVAGASAAFHLMKAGVRDMVVIDGGLQPGEGVESKRSGTAVMEVAPAIKMMVQIFASKSQAFLAHHGRQGARRYLKLTQQGIELQKVLAKQVLERPHEQLVEKGSYYVGYPPDVDELREEFETLQSLGCDSIEWCDKERLLGVPGMGPNFECAIYFPNDAVIDSSSYAKGLLQVVQDSGAAQVSMNTRVSQVIEQQNKDTGLVELESGVRVQCKHVVMATGGLFQIPQLCGLIKPCYSYLVHVPIETVSCETSSNFFTWGFSHDWCFTNGKVRCSGEDHFSAHKPPLQEERCSNLSKWTLQQYKDDDTNIDFSQVPQQHGVYSETPDLVPLIGHLKSDRSSKVCYLLGCNAWGQAVMSYSSSLVPGLLGYKSLDENQKDNLKLLSIRRFSCLNKIY